MSTDYPKSDLEALRKLLEGRDAQRSPAEDAAESLARALLDLPPADIDCETARAALPARMEAELAGAPVTPELARIDAHLAACAECGFLYATLLDNELAWGLDAPPRVEAPLPAPNLSFLPRPDPFERLREFVTGLAQDIIGALQPAALPQLAYLLEPFFERARELPRGAQLRPSLAAGALGLGGRGNAGMPAAVVYLAASFLATRELSANMTPERIASLQAEGRFEQEARQVALRAASDAGLRQPDAVRFANEFTRRIASAAELPPNLDD